VVTQEAGRRLSPLAELNIAPHLLFFAVQSPMNQGSSPKEMRRMKAATIAGYEARGVITESELAPKPANPSHTQVATVPLAGLSPWQALLTKGKLQKGQKDQKVLIYAGLGDASMLTEIGALIEQGAVKHVIDSIFAMQDANAAYEKLARGHAVGKIVVRISE
jgi:NADPH:quinone reductase-like Zn-dependent oxidoreductase